MKIRVESGEVFDVVHVHNKESYSGFMMGTLEIMNEFIFEDLRRNIAPPAWQKYPFVELCMETARSDLTSKLPPRTCVALLVSESPRPSGKDAVIVAAWFQDKTFGELPGDVLNALKKLDVSRCKETDFYS